jgi:hypothetical protein
VLLDILCPPEKTLNPGGHCQVSLDDLNRAGPFAIVVSEYFTEGKGTYLSHPSVHTPRHDISSRLLRSIEGYGASASTRFLDMHFRPPLGSEVRHGLLLAFANNPS